MKSKIIDLLKWMLNKLEPKPTLKDKLMAWPFPDASEDFEPRPRRKPRVAKATTRTVAKKATTVAKKTTKKAK